MSRPLTSVAKTLSVRISLMVAISIALFLLTALTVMFWYSQKVMKEETLQKAFQTLETTVLQIDNVLLSVEQAAGNVYWDLLLHLHQPEKMFDYSRQLVESNPYITGCAIAFEPNYYQGDNPYFMAYVYQNKRGGIESESSPIIQASTFGNVPYTEQVWYREPIRSRRAYWFNPIKDEAADGEAIITFSLPVFQRDKVIGVMGVDVSLEQLSHIVSAVKPSPNSYAVLLGSNGSYIVHPDSTKIFHESVFHHAMSPGLKEIGLAMMAGETDYKPMNINGTEAYIFFKPFRRSAVPGRTMEDLGWSIGLIYPEKDIFGEQKNLLYIVLLIAFTGLLLLFLLCRVFTHRLLLPLRHLTSSAQRIADGDYDTPILDCKQEDEVGRLQNHFQQMQQSLSAHMGELRKSTAALMDQGLVVSEAYEQAKEADRMKTDFLHNMTNQMIAPVNAMSNSVSALCDDKLTKTKQVTDYLVNDIQQQGKTITDLLDQLLKDSRESKQSGKEPAERT